LEEASQVEPLYDDPLTPTDVGFIRPAGTVYETALPSSSFQGGGAIDLAPTLAGSDGLRIKYNVAPEPGADVTVFKDDLLAESVQSFDLALLIELPLKLKVTPPAGKSYASLTFDELGSEPLFGGGGDSSMNDLLERLESMKLVFKNQNEFLTNAEGVSITVTSAGLEGWDLYLDTETPIDLNKDDVAAIMQNGFAPKVEIRLPEGEYAIKRGGSFGTTVSVTAVATIDETISLGGGN
jgi:hypothetical protein